jgi:hypothetical protein
METNYFKSGSWNAICDVCGVKYKNFQLRKRWDGLMVCSKDFENRHISDFFKLKPEINNVHDPRHEAADQFVSVSYISTGDAIFCTPEGSTGIVGLAVIGCAHVGRGLPI